MDTPTKRCYRCQRELELDKFHKDNSKQGGHRPYCKECNARPSSDFRERLPDGYKRCSACHKLKPTTNTYFGKSANRPDGMNVYCKHCVHEKASVKFVPRWKQPYKYGTVPTHKICTICNITKPFEEFCKSKNSIGGRSRMCKMCDVKRRTEWRKNNPEEAKHRDQEARKRNPQKARRTTQIRRARKRNADGTYSQFDIERKYKAQKAKCYYCGISIKDGYHIDHVVPLSRGGSNWPDNLVLACPSCNNRKHNKLPHEWTEGGRLL